MSWRVPVLTYHAANVAGDDYVRNDHVALAEDLAMLARDGWRILPLRDVAAASAGTQPADFPRKVVALSCDDGTDLDVVDVDWPGHGPQRGFLTILDDAAEADASVQPTMTSFVIADPAARARMDRDCLFGRDWMREWWAGATATSRIDIGCHSWDHNHPALDWPAVDGMPRGSFLQVDSEARARFEIDQALDYLNARIAPATCRLFAWPFGQAPAYARDEYLPRHAERLGLLAAFGTQGEPAHGGSPRWELPRFVCGWHWKSPDDLRALLADAAR